MLVEAHNAPDFARVVSRANIVAPDGQPLAWALKLMHGIRQERVAGMDLLPDLLQQAELNRVPVYFYGGNQDLLDKTRLYVERYFPSLQIAGLYSPPFRSLSAEEDASTIEKINSSGAQLVFVVLGCPKQEKWMAQMQGRINAVMIGIGGALPVLLGVQSRAPMWMQYAGLEWLFRMSQEPGRLFSRYAITNSVFLLLLLKGYISLKLFKKGS
jgi:N-acetylglucosaminyldiphosphoundecaprenol N-acetyl-beta-D-mannosaminyltransferase